MTATEPEWRTRAVARSVDAARDRAEQRVQRFLDAAFALIDERGSTEFSVQDVAERSRQSLRTFYEYFDSLDELMIALFEETVREALHDIRAAVDRHEDPLDRVRAFVVTLYDWCDPDEHPRKRGEHVRRPVSEFAVHLAPNHAERVRAALVPQTRLLRSLLDDAGAAGALGAIDPRRAAALVQQMVFSNWFGNRLIENPDHRIGADEMWDFCRRGLGA